MTAAFYSLKPKKAPASGGGMQAGAFNWEHSPSFLLTTII